PDLALAVDLESLDLDIRCVPDVEEVVLSKKVLRAVNQSSAIAYPASTARHRDGGVFRSAVPDDVSFRRRGHADDCAAGSGGEALRLPEGGGIVRVSIPHGS